MCALSCYYTGLKSTPATGIARATGAFRFGRVAFLTFFFGEDGLRGDVRFLTTDTLLYKERASLG
jgi:hypothetical protein